MVIMWRKVRERNLTVEISRNADWAMTLIGSHAFDNLPVYKRNQTAWFCRINKVAYEERPESIGSRGNCLDNGCQRKNLWLIGALAEKADALSIVPCCLSIMLVFSSLLYIYIFIRQILDYKTNHTGNYFFASLCMHERSKLCVLPK